ncbi:hypothetical protein V8G54_003090 [Vigna mungo]|uniref:Uncharacterized protein n=1 Tax=Vigna mungo TaxID=3915 RepID=A0AAQ3PB56_VIGMU
MNSETKLPKFILTILEITIMKFLLRTHFCTFSINKTSKHTTSYITTKLKINYHTCLKETNTVHLKHKTDQKLKTQDWCRGAQPLLKGCLDARSLDRGAQEALD